MNDIADLGSILGIWAHPDDETFCSGGLMILAQANGQRIGCITATKGESGIYHPEQWSAEEIVQTRTKELETAQNIIGVRERHQLGFVDGACKDVVDNKVLKQLLPIIESFQPDTILTFASDGITGHDDHKSVSRWARLAVEEYAKPVKIFCAVTSKDAYETYLQPMDEYLNIFFNIDKPKLYTRESCDLALSLQDKTSRQKCRALQAMQSQTSDMFAQFPTDYIYQAFSDEYFVLADNEQAM